MPTKNSQNVEKLLQAHAPDIECKAAARTIIIPGSQSIYNCDSLSVPQAPVDVSLKLSVPVPVRASALHPSHYTTLNIIPRKQRMQDSMSRISFWSFIGNDVDATMKICALCAQHEFQKRSSRELQFTQLLKQSSIWPSIFGDHFRNCHLVANRWQF